MINYPACFEHPQRKGLPVNISLIKKRKHRTTYCAVNEGIITVTDSQSRLILPEAQNERPAEIYRLSIKKIGRFLLRMVSLLIKTR